MAEVTGNLVFLQTGVPTAVANSTLCGIIDEALRHDSIEEICGAIGGVAGLLSGRLVDLGLEKRKVIDTLRRTPGSALGSGTARLSAQEAEAVIASLKQRNVRALLISGGFESIEAANAIDVAAKGAQYELAALAIIQSALNDIPVTDHCPGYGSAARWLAFAARDLYCEVKSRREDAPVAILQVLGETSGWLAAATALGKEGNCGPHLIYFPERPAAEEQLVSDVQSILQQSGACVVVVADGSVQRSDSSKVLAQSLAELIMTRLNLTCTWTVPNAIQRLSQLAAARTDADEAFAVGQTAVRLAVDGNSGYAVTLRREAGAGYKCISATARLDGFSQEPRTLPDEYLNADGNYVTEAFLEYARPLMGGPLPDYAVLECIAVEGA